MIIKDYIDIDFVNYKLPSMTIMTPRCNGFKCDAECGKRVCQNSALATAANIEIPTHKLIKLYLNNPVTQAIVFQGLEPFDSWNEINEFIWRLRYNYNCDDPVVIYTGYTEEELHNKGLYPEHFHYGKVIIKYGRYIPDQESHHDEILGVNLASPNQYAKEYN